MSVYDQILAAAQNKDGYVAGAPSRSGERFYRAAPDVNSLASFGAPRIPRAPMASTRRSSRSSDRATRLRQIIENREFDTDVAGAGDDGIGIGDIFGGVIKAADFLKSGYQGLAGEVGDFVSGLELGPAQGAVNTALGNPFQMRNTINPNEQDNEFNPTQIWDDATQGTQFLESTPWTEDVPGPLRPVVGFAGDVVTDPLTYLTAGTVKAGTGAATGVGRLTLAQDVAEQAFRSNAVETLGKQVTDDLVRNAGKQGLGALTDKSLAKIGTTADDVRRAGIAVPEFKYTAGVGSARATLPGSRRLAQGSENLKGAIKEMVGGSKAASITRRLSVSSKNAERELVNEILTGAESAPVAALGLTTVRRGRGDAYTWMQETANEFGRSGLNKLDSNGAKAFTHAFERGAGDEVSNNVRKTLDDAFQYMAALGVEGADGELLRYRAGYLPHRLSQAALDNADNPAVAKYLEQSLGKTEGFQKVREMDGYIDEINDAFKRDNGVDFNLLEDDVHELLATYLHEGKEAIIRTYLSGNPARNLGLVRPMNEVVDGKAVQGAVDAEVSQQVDALRSSIRSRKEATTLGTKLARERRDALRLELNASKREAGLASRNATRLRDRIGKRNAELSSLEQALEARRASVGKLKAADKRAATRAITKIEKQLANLTDEINADYALLAKVEKGFAEIENRIVQGENALDKATDKLIEAEEVRSAMEDGLFLGETAQADKVLQAKEAQLASQAERFATATSEDQVALNTNLWLGVDAEKAANKTQAELTKFTDWLAKPAVRERHRSMAGLQQAQDDLRQRTSELLTIMRDNPDPQVKKLAALEAQANVADMKAWQAGGRAQKLKNMDPIQIMSDPKFQDMVSLQSDIGWTQIGDTKWQADDWYKGVIEKVTELTDPKTRSDAYKMLQKGLRGYQKALGWWKGWATATPGFHVRNAYGGLFGWYLDGVSPADALTYRQFHRQWAQHGSERAAQWATEKYGPETAARLSQAVEVSAASGWGITTQEAGEKLVGARMSWNPLSSNQPLVYGSRHVGEAIESTLRGAHAYSVMNKGGSFNEALSRVQKFHFNYRDISEFDQAAKMVMPFWTFFSRNLALQAQVWARNPGKLNRSYFNAKRNIEFMSETDEPVPDYLLKSMGGIRTPFGGADGGRMYLTPDLPSIRVREVAADPLGGVVGGLTPGLKVPLETLMGKDTFTGRDFKNDYTQMTGDGPIARMAPGFLQAPGVRNVADLLPGTKLVNDQLLMTDQTQKALENVNPLVGRLNRLMPNMPRQQETWRQSTLNLLGAPVRWNDPGAQAGELARQRGVQLDRAAALALEAQLKALTS